MTLRRKLLLPLLAVAAAIGAYLFSLWMPQAEAEAEAVHLRRIQHHLDTVEEGLVPLLLGSQLDIIHENLNALFRKNEDWVEVRLFDDQGRQLYPAPFAPARPPLPGGKVVENDIMFLGKRVGHLSVEIDLGPALAHERQRNLRLAGLILALVGTMLAVAVSVVELAVRRPVRQLGKAVHGLAAHDFSAPLPPARGDEVGTLVEGFGRMRDELRRFHNDLMVEIEERQAAERALRQLNRELEERVAAEIAKGRETDHILIQQSHLAAMGEMVHNIAHQWRQPLNSLSRLIGNIHDDVAAGRASAESMNADVAMARGLIEKMSLTIDDFRDFFRPDREPALFDVGHAVRDAVAIVDAALKNNRVDLRLVLQDGITASGYSNRYAQAVLNLLVNAKEALVERKVANGWIDVSLGRYGHDVVLSVEDNAGGIPEEILPRIFDPYFTTKERGSGSGLYMVKTIVEKGMGGRVEAFNVEGGARFVITIPLAGEQ